jgi:hypothetical protein
MLRTLLKILWGFISSLMAVTAFSAQPLEFRKLTLDPSFYAEGAAYADINRDGHNDIVAGPYWYEGPDFTQRHEIYPPVAIDPHLYSANFFAFASDFNGDGWPDVLVFGFPGKDASWYENPKNARTAWARHVVLNEVSNESPAFAQLVANGPRGIVCANGGRYGWAAPADKAHADKPWIFHPISAPSGKIGPYTHGLGIGDVNGDGRNDVLDYTGWWEQPASLAGDPVWARHEFGSPTGRRGGAQMYAADLTGDGLADVISGHDAHGYGLSWFEQKRGSDGTVTWRERPVLATKGDEKIKGVQFSQVHAIAVADMDGDGRLDIVAGKRWWAHGDHGDVEPNAPAVLYVFRQARLPDGSTEFEPQLVDSESGVGTQLTAADIDGDGRPDILVSNKRGTFVFLTSTKSTSLIPAK